MEKTACAVFVRPGAPVWQKTATLSATDDWAAVVHSLLAALPSGRRRPLSARLSLGSPYACCKPLFGVSANTSMDAVNLDLLSRPSSFFLGDESAYLTSAAVRVDGHWWAATLDRQMVDAVASASSLAQIPFCGSIPSERIEGENGLVAAATAVATAPSDAPFIVDPLSRARESTQRRRARIALAGLLVMAAAFAFCAPAIATRWKVNQGNAALLRAKSEYQRQVANSGVPPALRGALADASSLSAESEALILLIHRLATALPDSAAFLSVKIDSAGGSLVIASRLTASPLREFAAIEGLSAPRLLGPMISSEISGIPVTRSTLSFRRSSPSPQVGVFAGRP